MKHGILMTCLVIALTVAPVLAQVGAKKGGDPRVQALLDEAELRYEIDADGDFKLLNGFSDDRSQIVFIFSHTSTLGSMEIREVWSVGYIADGPMSVSVAKNLLEENARVKLGAWELSQFGGNEAGVFRAQIAANTDMETLLMTLQAVSETADEKEKELLGNDDL